MLQTRSVRRTPRASIRMAVDMVTEGLITERDAILRVDPQRMLPSYTELADLTIMADESKQEASLKVESLCAGVASCQGAATGILSFTPQDCIKKSIEGKSAIYCVLDSGIFDYQALKAAAAVITISGSLVSDTAVICRSLGIPCVTGALNMRIEAYDHLAWVAVSLLPADALNSCDNSMFRLVSDKTGDILAPGATVTVDGTNGYLYKGVKEQESVLDDDAFRRVLGWAEGYRNIKVLSSISSKYAQEASFRGSIPSLSSDGIGLVSTENMMTSTEDRLHLFRSLLLTSAPVDEQERAKQTLTELLKQDYLALFKTCHGSTITIQLFDSSLSSVLPQSDTELKTMATQFFRSVADMKHMVSTYQESDPRLGLRGCKLSAALAVLLEIQITSIISVIVDMVCDKHIIYPTIALPGITNERELKRNLDMIQGIVVKVSAFLLFLMEFDNLF